VQLDAPFPDTEPNPHLAHTVLLDINANEDEVPGGHFMQVQSTKQFGAPIGFVQLPYEPAAQALAQETVEALPPPTVPDKAIPMAEKYPASTYKADPDDASFSEIKELIKETLPPSILIPPPFWRALLSLKEVFAAEKEPPCMWRPPPDASLV
jgi:hypothetical protein